LRTVRENIVAVEKQ